MKMSRITKLSALLAGLLLTAASAQAESVLRAWGGGEHGWAGWTSQGQFSLTSAGLPGDPTPGKQYWTSADPTTGTLRSPVMRLEGDVLRFYAEGWDGLGWDIKELSLRRSRFELRDAKSGQTLRQAGAPFNVGFVRNEWYVGDLKGREVYFEAVDGLGQGWNATIGLGQVQEIRKDQAAEQSPYRGLTLGDASGRPSGGYAEKEGVPFLLAGGASAFEENKTRRIEAGFSTDQIFLAGMTGSLDQGCPVWDAPGDDSLRFFIGDWLGELRLVYADGVTEHYPLVLGENLWWGLRYVNYPEPFASDAKARALLDKTLHLYPKSPSADGRYLAVIRPRPVRIDAIELEDSGLKRGVPVVAGLTIKAAAQGETAKTVALPHDAMTTGAAAFATAEPLKADLTEQALRQRLHPLQDLLYTTLENFPKRFAREMPAGYAGPQASFEGDAYAEALTNVFHHNVHDMQGKVDLETGFYHESSKGTSSWGDYKGFGTFQRNMDNYYTQPWSRGVGIALCQMLALGYDEKALKNAEWDFRMARVWEEKPHQLKGKTIPAHWCRVLTDSPFYNTYTELTGCFENDGHGLTAVFIYNLWRRQPQREAWLKANWEDVKKAAEFIIWQFENPEVFGTTDVLRTDSECAPGIRTSIYADYVCMDTLVGFAEMADSIGKGAEAAKWRQRAAKMRKGIERNYLRDDLRYGKVWGLDVTTWAYNGTVLGPLTLAADRRGFTPEDDDPAWRAINEASYRWVRDPYQPRGFYGIAMGYGQGFLTQSALLLDQMQDATEMTRWLARAVYNRLERPWIVPEGCEVNADGTMWFRTGDLGNGFQQHSTVKTLRLVLGVDDFKDQALRLYPRMPYGWTKMSISDYPAYVASGGKHKTIKVAYELTRHAKRGMTMKFTASEPVDQMIVRLGPFAQRPESRQALLDGQPIAARVEHGGDAWWVLAELKGARKQFTLNAR